MVTTSGLTEEASGDAVATSGGTVARVTLPSFDTLIFPFVIKVNREIESLIINTQCLASLEG